MSKIGNLGNLDIDIFEDFSLSSMNNVNIGQFAGKGIKGTRNVFIGKNAGKIAYEVNNSVFIGSEAGIKILTGNKNYIIGEDKSGLLEINSIYNIGNNEIYKDKSITIGNNIINSNNNISINNQLNINNSNINIEKYKFGEIINLGINNFNNSNINIGNNNSNINISIGSSNSSIISNSIIIGNNIENYKFSLNIDNIICKYNSNNNKIIYLGIGFYENIPIIIGSKNDYYFNENEDLFIKGALSTNKIRINNNNNGIIELKLQNNQNGNIIYYLPSLPEKYENIYLSTDKNGNLTWLEITDVLILTIITQGDTLCNDLISSNIIGRGNFLTNINIKDKTTDELNEGIRNLYLTIGIISTYFLSLIETISTNIIKDGENNSNIYFTEERYKKNFYNNLNLFSTDNIKKGNNIRFYTSNDFYINPRLIFKTLTTDDLKMGNINSYFNEDGVNKSLSNVFNLVKEGSSNFFYTNERLLRNFNNYLNFYNTNQIIQGSNNKFYDDFISSNTANLFFLNNVSTDFFREGSNLFSGDERLIRFFNSKIITTNDIPPSNNLNYFNSNLNFNLNTDLIKQGSNRYINNQDVLNTITFNTNTDFYKTGNSNIYGTEKLLISDFSRITSNEYTTDNLNFTNNKNKFITNNFYNNDIFINGFLKASNVNNIDLEALREIVDEIRIGPQTQVIHTYDVNTFNIQTQLSNIEINYNSDFNNTIPFIVINNKVGIHNINPNYELDVNGFINCCNLIFNSNNLSNILNTTLKYDNNLNIGIGTTRPIEKLQVIGNVLASGTIISSFSDIRLKEFIEPLNNSLQIIEQLSGFKYKPNDIAKKFGFDEKIDIGLNAQEVQKIIPEIVSIAPFDIDKDGDNIISKSGENYLSLRYERIIPYLIEAIKELNKNQLKIIDMINNK